MNNLEDRVSSALRAAASDVSHVRGLAEGARARRRRRRSVHLSVAACVAVATIVIPAAFVISRDADMAPTRRPSSPDASQQGTDFSAEPKCEALTASPPPRPSAVSGIPDPEARHVAVNETGTIAAWFNVSGTLPELTVFDLANDHRLAREDLGVGEIVRPSTRIFAGAVYYRTAVDPNVWMRYRWSTDSYPAFYRTCTQTSAD